MDQIGRTSGSLVAGLRTVSKRRPFLVLNFRVLLSELVSEFGMDIMTISAYRGIYKMKYLRYRYSKLIFQFRV
jgi:hypothetical protein